MAWLKSFCASSLQEVSKLTVPSVVSSACAGCASARPLENAIAIARVVFIALLLFFGRFDCEARGQLAGSHKRETGFYSRIADGGEAQSTASSAVPGTPDARHFVIPA